VPGGIYGHGGVNTVRFSVIVPTCHRNDALADCLVRLAPGAQALGAEAYEVIVTDDGATSTAEQMLRERFPWARWTAGPRRGPAANRNHGARQARGEWLVFTDDDCLPAPGWLAAFARAATEHPAARVLEGRTLASGVREAIDWEAPINLAGGNLWSCNFAIRPDLFAALDGFDTGFPGSVMEDVEFCLRLRQRGVGLTFVEQALVEHPWRRRKGFRFIRVYAQSVDYYLNKHPGQYGYFAPGHGFRVLLGTTYRHTREGLSRFGGRGVLRVIGLEIYAWVLISGKNLRRGRRRPR
jgi:GT2 family glycosyltransferase